MSAYEINMRSPEPESNIAVPMKQLYVRDPDGYVLCFQWQAFD